MNEFKDNHERLEQRLRSIRPVATEALESEVLYRCGWEAALASQRNLNKPTVPYGLGVLSGIAATLVFSFIITGPGRELNPQQTAQQNPQHDSNAAIDQSPTEGPVFATQDNSATKKPNQTVAPTSGSKQFAYSAPTVHGKNLSGPSPNLNAHWQPQYVVSVASPIRNESSDCDLLSLAAQNRWRNTLAIPTDQANSSSTPTTNQNSTVAEMLLEVGRNGIF